MGPIMNGNCLRVSSYFGKNRIFATYSIMVDPSIIVTNVLELLLCVLLHCGWELWWWCRCRCVTVSLYCCCRSCYFTHIIIIGFFYLIRFFFFFFFWTDGSTLCCTTSYIWIILHCIASHRSNLCHLHHIWMPPFIHLHKANSSCFFMCAIFFECSSECLPFVHWWAQHKTKRNEMKRNKNCHECKPHLCKTV